jgi:hypothetical protein
MNRWIPMAHAARFRLASALFFLASFAGLTVASGVLASDAHAQTATQNQPLNLAPRPFPKNAKRGTMVVLQPPVIQMDGSPARLSPGARIFGTNHLLVMSGAIVGQSLTVNHVVDTFGLVSQVWILTPEEAALKRWNSAPQGYSSQYDTKPVTDDGKTPYSQLPGYGSQSVPSAPSTTGQ